MTLRAVLDVNILASAAYPGRGVISHVVRAGLRRQYQLVTSDHILDTLKTVLTRPYFASHLTGDEQFAFISSVRDLAKNVEPDSTVTGIADDDEDDKVLGTAVAADADFLVTGDHGLLSVRSFRDVQIVTAREFLAVLDR